MGDHGLDYQGKGGKNGFMEGFDYQGKGGKNGFMEGSDYQGKGGKHGIIRGSDYQGKGGKQGFSQDFGMELEWVNDYTYITNGDACMRRCASQNYTYQQCYKRCF